MNDPTVRRADARDLPAVAEIWVRSWQAAYDGIIPAAYLDSLDPAERHQRLVTQQDDPTDPSELFVAVQDGRISGFVSLRCAEIWAIYVDPEFWGCGTGRALLDRALRHLDERGYSQPWLWVLEENARARRFYETAGWELDGAREPYDVGGATLSKVRYARHTGPSHG